MRVKCFFFFQLFGVLSLHQKRAHDARYSRTSRYRQTFGSMAINTAAAVDGVQAITRCFRTTGTSVFCRCYELREELFISFWFDHRN